MANPGVAPPDISTAVGQLRTLLGDTSYVALVPPITGQGDYAVWSDAALETSLAIAGDSLLRAAGNLYAQLAVEYIQVGRSTKTDDLAIDTRGRGSDLLKVAQSFWDQADASDASAADEFFEVVPLGGRPSHCVRPEGTPWPCHCGGNC